MTINDILAYSGGGLVLFLTLIEITPIKLNPWSWLAQHIGNAFNHDVLVKLKEHDKKFEDIAENEADQYRQKILEFNDGLLHKTKHSKEFFDSMLHTIDKYESYCKKHEGYKNSIADLAIKNIKNTYEKLSADGGFL